MSSFSSVACYAALSSCTQKDILSAYARMVAALVQKNKYQKCEAERLVIDFEALYGFKVPYHPMRTIMDQCVRLGFFTYNSAAHSFFPDPRMIAEDNFAGIINAKESNYKKLLGQFGDFLISKHGIYSSPEDLDERIRAFIERFGIKSKIDRTLLRKITEKDDYFFAEFLVCCEENGNSETLNYLNEYTIGLALSEIFTYCETPETFTAKNVHAYLDTGLLFKIFGIGSSNHENSYIQYIRNMQRIGIRVMVYEHTVNEMIGIIEGSKHWIGNPDFDATLSSEATYFFVTNGWSVGEIDELSSSLRYRLENEFNIKIDDMSYPKHEDIHTPHEEDIRAMIVERYKENRSENEIDALTYTIDRDALSIFYTQHKNGNNVAYRLNDIRNVFITTNNSLAAVGYKLSYSLVQSKDVFIPVVMNDIKWGTLIWFNSPALLSSINRPRLVSAAYAAFRPNDELIRKLNERLSQLEKDGAITPEQCYLLKVNPVAQQLLSQKTMNDPTRFIDATPLEILKELGKESFEMGSASRQAEVDSLTKQSEADKLQLEIEKQKAVISGLEGQVQLLREKVKTRKERMTAVKKEKDELLLVRAEIDRIVRLRILTLNVIISLLAIVTCVLAVLFGAKYDWAIGLATFVAPILAWLVALWCGKKITYEEVRKRIDSKVREKQNSIRRYSEERYLALESEYAILADELKKLEEQLGKADRCLSEEKQKIDRFSIDVSLTEKAMV